MGALGLYFLYFSQLFCESRAAGHGTIIVPLVLIHLICAAEHGTWSIFLLKAHISFCYFSAGYAKIATSIFFRKFWADGTALQFTLWEAMWSRPGGAFSQFLQEQGLQRPWLMSLASIGTLGFQLSVPLALLDIRFSWFFFALSFSFHAGILVVTNISFMPYWVPALLIFLFPHGAAPFDGPYESAVFAIRGAWDAGPIGLTMVFLYLLAQVIVTLLVVDLTYGDVLPISCEPMFALPRSLHDQWPKLVVLTSADCCESGHLEPYVHCSFNPLSKVFPLSEKDMTNLPSRTLIFATFKTIPPEMKQFIRDDALPTPFRLWANVPVDDELYQSFKGVADLLNDSECENPVSGDPDKLQNLIELQRQCVAGFQQACLEPTATFGFRQDDAIADARL